MEQAAAVTATDTVRYERQGRAGIVELNRPKAINSLDLPMVASMLAQLTAWADDPSVESVVLLGGGDRGLCAGGDVVQMRAKVMGSPGEHAGAIEFWDTEYDLDALLAAYPKPVAALMDGVCMGGGIGIAGHASPLRIVTGRSRIAMPETIIGFFPDVGGLHLLAQAPGELGTHLALTGATVSGADALALGLADVLVEREELPGIVERLAAGDVPAAADLGATADTAGPAPLLEHRSWIDACYAGDDAAAIVEALRGWSGPGADAAHAAADDIEARSPYAVAVTLAALRRAHAAPDLEAVLRQDRALARVFADEPDFREGVRALLVDKDKAPRWRHGHVREVTTSEVEAAFAHVGR